MDIETCITLIDNNVGRGVIMEVVRMGLEKEEKIIGTIKEPFSNEVSPSCQIEVDGAMDEIFVDEVRAIEII